MSGAYRYQSRLPLGVAILSILIGIFGVFILAVGLLALLVGVSVGGATVFGMTGALAGIVLAVIGLVTLALATGLWDQELWALALAIIVLLFYGAIEFVAGAWLGVLIAAVLVLYLAAVSPDFS